MCPDPELGSERSLLLLLLPVQQIFGAEYLTGRDDLMIYDHFQMHFKPVKGNLLK